MALPRNVFISPLLPDRMGRRFFSCLRFVNQILMSPGQVDSFSWATLQPANPFCLLDKLCSAQVPGAWYLSMPHCLTSLWLGIWGRAALRLLQVLRRQGLGYSRSFCQVGVVAQYVCVSTTTLREGVAVNPRSSQTPPRRIWMPSIWAAAFKSGEGLFCPVLDAPTRVLLLWLGPAWEGTQSLTSIADCSGRNSWGRGLGTFSSFQTEPGIPLGLFSPFLIHTKYIFISKEIIRVSVFFVP